MKETFYWFKITFISLFLNLTLYYKVQKYMYEFQDLQTWVEENGVSREFRNFSVYDNFTSFV